MTDVDEAKAALSTKKRKAVIPARDLLSSGSTTLNLACSGRVKGAFAKGFYYWMVGDSDSGKTFLSMTCLAEAAKNPEFDGYRFVVFATEHGMLMDIERFFGKKVKERLEVFHPETVEEFYYKLDDMHKEGTPFIAILDSMDSLETEADRKKFKKQKAAKKNDKEAAGDMGMAKAKLNSTNIRKVIARLPKTKSILLIISQTRDNTGMTAKYEPSKASGGRSLKFYATCQIWSKPAGSLQKTYKNKKRELGIKTSIKVRKNRITGRKRNLTLRIYHSAGFDDVGSNIDYLVDEGHWSASSEVKVNAPEFDFKGLREDLIHKIEEENLETELRQLVTQVWNDIEKACEVQRKPRYE